MLCHSCIERERRLSRITSLPPIMRSYAHPRRERHFFFRNFGSYMAANQKHAKDKNNLSY
jgi:hypothetical protein